MQLRLSVSLTTPKSFSCILQNVTQSHPCHQWLRLLVFFFCKSPSQKYAFASPSKIPLYCLFIVHLFKRYTILKLLWNLLGAVFVSVGAGKRVAGVTMRRQHFISNKAGSSCYHLPTPYLVIHPLYFVLFFRKEKNYYLVYYVGSAIGLKRLLFWTIEFKLFHLLM